MDNLKVVLDLNKENQPLIMLEEEKTFNSNLLDVDMNFLRTDIGPRSPKKLPAIGSPSKSPLRSGNWQVSKIINISMQCNNE